MKHPLKELLTSIGNWFLILIGLSILIATSFFIGKWLNNKLWIIPIMDCLFCFFLWIFLVYFRKFSLEYARKHVIIQDISIGMMIIIFVILVLATLGLLELFFVRLNIILFFGMTGLTLYLFYKNKHKIKIKT